MRLLPPRATLAVCVSLALSAGVAAAQECIVWTPPLLFDTSDDCDARPSNPKVLAVNTFYWNGSPYLIANTGNNLAVWRVSNPLNPGTRVETTRLTGSYLGDRDYNLSSFSVCDDCRYGVAAFPSAGQEGMGATLFDLGTGQNPIFQSGWQQYAPARYDGAFTFQHNGQQYLLINGMPGGSSTTASLFLFNGVSSGDLQKIQDVTALGLDMVVVNGFYVPSASGTFVYVFDTGKDGHVFQVTGSGASLRLNFLGTFFRAGFFQFHGMRVDTSAMLAATASGESFTIWDISVPDQPAALATVTPEPGTSMTSIGLTPSALFVAKKGRDDGVFTYDITVPTSPTPLDQGFWNPDHDWNDVGSCQVEYDGVFSPDGVALYSARKSTLQMFDFSQCGSTVPMANLSLSRQTLFPGEEVTITNISTGAWTRSAKWVTLGSNPQGQVVAGSLTLATPTTPDSIDFTVPVDIGPDTVYYAHVAVESDEHPFSFAAPGDQIESRQLVIDRTPEVTAVVLTPEDILTGENATVTASVEGSPSGDLAWQVTPPVGQSFPMSGNPITLLLDASGTWTFAATASYAHIAQPGQGLWQHTTSLQFPISAVAAAFTVAPASPLNTQAITLDAGPSRPDGVQLAYDWSVTGATTYTGCPGQEVCVIPADTLNPGQHTVTLTVTRDTEQDTVVKTVNVADGSVNPDFSWSPTEPEIGTSVLFTISGVTADIEQATWNFGGSGCTGYTQTTVCTPGLFSDCKSASYKYASGGTKTVSVTVRVGGQNFSANPKAITIASTGSCGGGGGTCTYNVSASPSSFGAAGGSGTLTVDTQSGCAWSATDNASWISLGRSSGSGDASFDFNVSANSGAARTGRITVEDDFVTINQASSGGGGAVFTVSNSNPQIGEAVTFAVDGSSTPRSWNFGGVNCDGTAPEVGCIFSPALCRQLTWRYSSPGPKTVTYTDDFGAQSTQTVNVQATGSCPQPCEATASPPATFTLSNDSVLIGETVTFSYSGPVKASSVEAVALAAREEAEAQTLALGITSSPSSPRIGQQVLFLLSGLTGTVAQADWTFGGEGCGGEPSTATCYPSLFNDCKAMAFKYASGGQKNVTVSVTLQGGGGQNASTTLTVQNDGSCDTVPTCTFSISPSSASYGADGGTGAVTVNTQEGCQWQAVSNDEPWLQVTGGGAGTGPGQVQYSVASNDGVSRSGVLKIAGKDFNVSQAGTAPGGGDEAESWEWTVTLGSQEVASSDSAVFSYAFDQPGTYTVRLEVSNCFGSSASTKTFTVIEINDYVVPAAAHAAGQFDTTWKTDLRLFNPGTNTVTVTLDFLQEARNNAGIIPGVTFDMPPKGTVIIDDVLTVIPGIPVDGSKGALRFSFEGGGTTPVIMSRTYNDTPEGTYGQYVPAVPVVPGDGQALYLTGLAHSADYRSNLGVANLSGHDIGGLTATVIGPDGAELGSYGIGVPAYSTIQVVNIARVAGVTQDLDLFTIRLDTNDTDVTAYASVIDNRTSDPVLFTPAVPAGAKSYLLGVAHAFGQNDSTWRSDVTLYNKGTGMSEVRVEYFPDVPTQFRPHITVPLMPGTAQRFGDILTSLVTDENTKGYLVLEHTAGDVTPQLVARTYNLALTGTFGQNVPLYGDDDLIPVGGMGILAGITNTANRALGYRTNLGLLNTGTAAARVDVTLYDENGDVVGKIPGYPLEPGQYVQFDVFQGLQLEAFDMDASIELKVLEGGPVAAYASIIDNQTQDPIFIPALPTR